MDLVKLVLGVRKHRGACKLWNSCFGGFLSAFDAGTELHGLDPCIRAGTSSKELTA